MFRLSSGKSFFLIAFFLLGASACGWRTAQDAPPPTPAPFVAPEIVSEIPFSTKEPEVFQTEIIVSHFDGAEKTESRTFVARQGARRVSIFNFGRENEIAVLAADGKTVRLMRAAKIYTETAGGAGGAAASAGESQSLIAAEWLNRKTHPGFENLGRQNNLTQFRVRSEENPATEILVFVDENLKLPVRQEFYSLAGDRRTLTLSVELANFKTDAAETLFQVPEDYKKVSAREFQQTLRQEKAKK